MGKTTPPIEFVPQRAYVIVDPSGLVLLWTMRYWLKDAKLAAAEWSSTKSWNEMKRAGYRAERCTVVHEWR